MKILNFGSCNIDIVYSMDHIVTVGETETSDKMNVFSGGKGLNQSIALARAGGKVFHAGCIGEDGDMLLELLKNSGVDVSGIKRVDGKNGHAIIQVSAHGDNSIFIYPGSNAKITPDFVDETLSRFERGDIILLQNELNAVDYIVEKAYEKGLCIVLNPSPCNENIEKIDFNKLSYLILNEIEAETLSGCKEPEISLKYFGERYPDLKVVLTLGKKGSIFYQKAAEIYQPAFLAEAVDTTAAGDTFTGYFIAGIAAHGDVEKALRSASAAAAIAVSRHGAAPSIPTEAEVAAAIVFMKESLPESGKIETVKHITEDYIERNLKDANVEALASQLGYSAAYTRSLIAKIYGKPLSKLLQEKRCYVASKFLADTDLSVSEIIGSVGYENESFFREIFKKKYGKNLLEYRNFMRNVGKQG